MFGYVAVMHLATCPLLLASGLPYVIPRVDGPVAICIVWGVDGVVDGAVRPDDTMDASMLVREWVAMEIEHVALPCKLSTAYVKVVAE